MEEDGSQSEPPTYRSVVYGASGEGNEDADCKDIYTSKSEGGISLSNSQEALNDIVASGTEGSSFSSTCSAQGLLTTCSISDDEKAT